MLKFQLLGPFALYDSDGVDRRPKLKKSRAILAFLAATPGHRHSRSWLQSLLWSDRQHEQALSSLRTALNDIRKHLGPYGNALKTDHEEVALEPAMFRVDLADIDGDRPHLGFLEGFDIAHAEKFEDWLRERRMEYDERPPKGEGAPASAFQNVYAPFSRAKVLLASHGSDISAVTRIQCETLVDCLAKSTEDLALGEVIDGRRSGTTLDEFLTEARRTECSLVLVSEAAESKAGAIARLKVIETESKHLVWSQSLVGREALDLDDLATIRVVAEFIDVIFDKQLKTGRQSNADPSPSQLGVSGVNHIFKLGAQNYETAEALLKLAHESDQRGTHLAWRAYLRTFLLCEREFGSRETVIEEGTALARRALEKEPHNSMVLALCAHVETMLHRSYRSALDLSERALRLNRCNPLAWATIGVAQAYLGETAEGFRNSQIGSRLATGSCYSFQTEAWSMVTGVLAGKFDAACAHAEMSHSKAPDFAPPLRFLTALHCMAGDFERAHRAAERLRAREPDFTMDMLREDGYPAASLRMGKVLDVLPTREI